MTSPKLSACSPVHLPRALVVNIPRRSSSGPPKPLCAPQQRPSQANGEREDAKAKPSGKRWQYLVVRSRYPGPAVDDNRKRVCRLENIGLQTLGKSVPARRAYGDVHRVHRPMKSQMRAPIWRCHPKALASLGHQTQPTVILPLAGLAIRDQLHRHHRGFCASSRRLEAAAKRTRLGPSGRTQESRFPSENCQSNSFSDLQMPASRGSGFDRGTWEF